MTVDADSVHGVRWWHHPDCDSCRVSLGRASVDSVRTLAHDSGATGALTIFVVPIVLFSSFFYILAHSD